MEGITNYVVNAATGATGSVFIRALCARVGSENIVCTVRPASDISLLNELSIRTQVAELDDPASYRSLLGPRTAYVGLYGAKTESFSMMLQTLIRTGVRRALFMGSTYFLSESHPKREFFQRQLLLLRNSGLDYTICHPSMIYGSSPKVNTIHKLLRLVSRSSVVPVVGDGNGLMQPVHAADLAQALLAALNDSAIGKEYVLAGPEALAQTEIIRLAADVLGRSVRLVHVPEPLAVALLRAVKLVRPGMNLRVDQLTRLKEDKAFDIAPALRDLGFNPRPLEQGMLEEAATMRRHGLLPEAPQRMQPY